MPQHVACTPPRSTRVPVTVTGQIHHHVGNRYLCQGMSISAAYTVGRTVQIDRTPTRTRDIMRPFQHPPSAEIMSPTPELRSAAEVQASVGAIRPTKWYTDSSSIIGRGPWQHPVTSREGSVISGTAAARRMHTRRRLERGSVINGSDSAGPVPLALQRAAMCADAAGHNT